MNIEDMVTFNVNGKKCVAFVRKLTEREAGAEAAQICGEICEMIGREEAKNQSVTNCNRLGNASKMRESDTATSSM